MKFYECTPENKDYTGRFDNAVKEVREALGSYDTISRLIYDKTGRGYSGVSVRRWLVNRTLPLPIACTLLDILEEQKPGNGVFLTDFFPYLEEYVI